MRELPHTRSCFVCGEANPLGLRLRFETDGQFVRARFTPRPEHAGFKGVLHGGLLMAVLDEIMVWACVVQARRFAFSAQMSTRFLRPARPHEPLTVTGELVVNRRGKIFEAKACVTNAAGEVLAEASGKYLPIKDMDLPPMRADLVGDWEWLLRNEAS
jgi:acyl-coenzyme A thioesterase PaaI-like protein